MSMTRASGVLLLLLTTACLREERRPVAARPESPALPDSPAPDQPGRIDRLGGRDVALLVDHYIGAHDVDQDRYRLATEVCGALFVSEPFAETYSAAWTLDQLSLALSPDGRELRIEGAREESNGVIYRLTFPSTCPGVPLTEDVHSGE